MLSRSKTLALLVLAITFSTGLCSDDEDDNIIGEIIIDVISGILIEECGKYQTCRMFLSIITITMLLTILMAWIITGECRCRPLTGRALRRVGTTYAGMRLRRAFG